MTAEEKSRLVNFLQSKMCRPCLKNGATEDHTGCLEAEALVEIVRRG